MKFLSALFSVLLVASLAFAAPTSKENDTIVIDQDFYPEELLVYTGDHEIIKITVPLNTLNFDENEDNELANNDDDDNDDDASLTIFFVQADTKPDGSYDYKGLYKLKNKKAKKILDNGRDVAASNSDNKLVFIAASDGLYVYNDEGEKVEKYGTINDALLSLAKENGTDLIYVLGEDYKVYKVTEGGSKKTPIEGIEHAHEIVLDFSNNLYFLGDDKIPHVYNGHEIKKIEGLPANPGYAKLIKPPFIFEDGVPYVSDDKSYVVYANGTSELTDFEIKEKPSAYAMEATLIQYFAHDKKIYEYNILALILGEMLSDLKNYLDDKKDTIQTIATRSRSDLAGL